MKNQSRHDKSDHTPAFSLHSCPVSCLLYQPASKVADSLLRPSMFVSRPTETELNLDNQRSLTPFVGPKIATKNRRAFSLSFLKEALLLRYHHCSCFQGLKSVVLEILHLHVLGSLSSSLQRSLKSKGSCILRAMNVPLTSDDRFHH